MRTSSLRSYLTHRTISRAVASFLVLAGASIAPARAQAPAPGTATPESPVRKLFVAQCAACHGETGDGVGTTKLDRPARSFLDGGFSYGNTLDAVVRTITHGIPGSVMPSFASSISEADRRALAEYVIALGPKDAIPETKDSVLVVAERALAVRGKLGPIVTDAPTRPRGLLVGTTDGLTFEYRVDDVRLLGVRTGAFCDRRDWRNRGGDFVEPLGKLVHVLELGDPRAMFVVASYPVHAQFRGTSTRGKELSVSYDLISDVSSKRLASVEEHGRIFVPGKHADLVPAGYERVFGMDVHEACKLEVCVARATKTPIVALLSQDDPTIWLVEQSEGVVDAYTVTGVPRSACWTSDSGVVRLEPAQGARLAFTVRVIPRALASITDAAAIQRVSEAFGR